MRGNIEAVFAEQLCKLHRTKLAGHEWARLNLLRVAEKKGYALMVFSLAEAQAPGSVSALVGMRARRSFLSSRAHSTNGLAITGQRVLHESLGWLVQLQAGACCPNR